MTVYITFGGTMSQIHHCLHYYEEMRFELYMIFKALAEQLLQHAGGKDSEHIEEHHNVYCPTIIHD